jgi:flagellar motility protein MotE (MotC chaperone)
MNRPRYLRLLPSVVLLGASLLVLKTTDVVQAATAETGEQVAAITEGPVPSNKDYAGGDDDQVSSASEVDVINSLAKRRRDLDARQGQLTIQANMIAATEIRVDAKITQLKQLQAQITALLGQRDEAQKAQIASLVKTYTAMKAADAARIFNSLPDDVLVPVAQQMKSDVLGGVLSKMNPDAAQKLTVKLANRLTLPQTADAVAPVAVTPVPGPAVAATPAAAPVQTAAAAPAAAAPAKAPEKSAEPKT